MPRSSSFEAESSSYVRAWRPPRPTDEFQCRFMSQRLDYAAMPCHVNGPVRRTEASSLEVAIKAARASERSMREWRGDAAAKIFHRRGGPVSANLRVVRLA
jgi:hypothetical protein